MDARILRRSWRNPPPHDPVPNTNELVTPPHPSDEKEWTSRKRTYCAQALILFNAYGIPLSFGPYLEYYYNTMYPHTPLWQLSLIPAVQVFLLFSMGPVGRWLYDHRVYRTSIFFATLLGSACLAVAGSNCRQFWQALIAQGVGLGVSLGILLAIGRLSLSSHYKNNFPLASMISASAGFVGALVYTAVGYGCLRVNKIMLLSWLNAAITLATLLVALGLVRRSKRYTLPAGPPTPILSIFRNTSSSLFLVGFFCVFFSLFAWPVHIVLFLSNGPGHIWPETATIILMATFGIAIFFAAYAANPYSRRSFGPVNTFIAASLLGGLCPLSPAWMPFSEVVSGYSVAYGTVLGAVLALHVKVISVFCSGDGKVFVDMPTQVSRVMSLAGLVAAVGIVAMSALATAGEQGLAWAWTVSGLVMFVGGLLVGVARWLRCRGFYVAI
ncbi:major facilitator superfamily domain-containing protein [Massariosphaeria phaeospora]|uniref:Major facilitator superfamily domain-containing protein n=1 Tax=Massariosphaeria phaeospora TaxID=100035 RepID=A0A7C8IEN1_9PLEO|nr:major facilitator superfamily domain-containing protein [Massariosphaeria phaeospora]